MSNIKEKITDARIKILKSESKLLFFGIIAYLFEIVASKLNEKIEGQILLDNKLKRKMIQINELYIEKKDYTYIHLIFLILHELMHLIKRDHLRIGSRNHDMWNTASDHCIDRDLEKSLKDIFPYKNEYNIIEQLNKELPKCSTEDAYNWLLKHKSELEFNDIENSAIQVKFKDQEFIVNNLLPKNDIDQEASQSIENIINEINVKATAIYQNLKERGLISNDISNLVDKLLQVKIPWNKLLEKAIKNSVSLKNDLRSWKKPNKFFIPHGIYLPGTIESEENDSIGILVISVDTSGSISKNNLSQFSSVIYQSFKYFREIILIIQDVQIHDIKKYTNEQAEEFINFINTIGFKGRGGTSHKYVFNQIEEYYEDNDFKDEFSICICLTDGYSDIEIIEKNYKWIKSDVPLIFVIPSDGKNIENHKNIRME